MSIYDIIQELNDNNGSNYKMDVLRKHSDNELLQRVLKMTYDNVSFTYGISLKNIDDNVVGTFQLPSISLEDALYRLENNLASRDITGNDAIIELTDILWGVSMDNNKVIRGIINRDLRINMGRSNINKVFKGLIVKPVYMRCGLYGEKTRKKIDPVGSVVQLKADGTYREFTVDNGKVSANSRSGEEYDYPIHFEILKNKPDGKYIGELTVMKDGKVLDRATGNGMINSSEPPHKFIVFDVWDFVTLEEYSNAANKIHGTTPYSERLDRLMEIFPENPEVDDTCQVQATLDTFRIKVIETHVVNSVKEALEWTMKWMNEGLEGAIWKDKDAIFRDGNSPQQLKLKLEIDIDVRVTGFKEGKKGTKREATFGAMYFETDDGTIQGATSGFSDKQLADFNGRRDELIGQIMTVCCNDITKSRSNDYHALSHPRFVEFRNDKTTTDDLERALAAKEMAMMVGEG